MRRGKAERRPLSADLRYNSKSVERLINMVMVKGKKSKAQGIVYGALDIISKKTQKNEPLEIFNKAIENIKPLLEVKSRRVGGATYQIPIEVKQERGVHLAMRWLRDNARNRKGKPMQDKLADEIMEAYKGEGAAVKKKEDMHKMAESNKAFSHFRW